MQNKNQVFQTIRDNIFRSYIFYIPKRYYPEIEKTFIKDIIKPDMVNIIAYSNLERKITTNTLEFNGLDILNKGDLLNDNIDQLFEQKEKVSETAFNHLLHQYKEHVDAHWIIISWMSKNILIDLPNTPLYIKTMFESQASLFNKHQTKFYSYFGLHETDNNIDINQYVKAANETIEDTPIIEIIEQEEKQLIVPKVKKSSKKTEKESLITDEKARKFLLETVFNIDPKYLD
ncbi:hypothetical protein [Xanthomarina spongicola]|uniref:Uncharacterized protein n=1 Tax=Xanthomarina spongicola TaxID=570520 RepID=A0A316DMX6_9FLAO|nr:hypothetical protein [Xanthomarina spongicola]PWK18549.1 hypothetical protein LX78_01856 [Xanthomarina spongicola]